VREWLVRHPRFVLPFIPASSSWLNLVERWFAERSQKPVRRGGFHRVEELEEAIARFMAAWNTNPVPFVWTARVEKILEKVQRCRRRLEQVKSGCPTPPSPAAPRPRGVGSYLWDTPLWSSGATVTNTDTAVTFLDKPSGRAAPLTERNPSGASCSKQVRRGFCDCFIFSPRLSPAGTPMAKGEPVRFCVC
jgi:hypothetical protein